MGFFGRLRSSSSATKDSRVESNSSTATLRAPGGDQTIRRSPSTNFLAAPPANGYAHSNGNNSPYQSPARASTSSTVQSTTPSAASRSRPFWKRGGADKKERDLPSLPYESTTPGPPVRARSGSTAPSIATNYSSPRPPQRTAPASAPPTQQRPSYSNQQQYSPQPRYPQQQQHPNSGHVRNNSQATVISLQSTFTGRSRSSCDSEEWKREGGILGKLNFESDGSSPGWGLDAKGKSSPRVSPVKASDQLPANSRYGQVNGHSQTNLTRQTSVEQPVIPKRSPMRKLAALTTTAPPPSNGPQPPNSAGTTPIDLDKDDMEEIAADRDDDSKRGGWGKRIRPRRQSSDRPPSPTLHRRPPSQTDQQRPHLRRPSSSIFHNPFHRTQSRVSLVDNGPTTTDKSSGGDDGSFQLKSFRHISGASDAEGGFDHYLSMVTTTTQTTTPSGARQFASQSEVSLVAPRPRPPSLAGSVDSNSRVSVAAFRKNVRRPSSSLLADGADDDDVPLSLSRSNLLDTGAGRNGSAVSLSDTSPSVPVLNVPDSPDARRRSPQRPSPRPSPQRPSTNLPSPNLQQNFVVKGSKSSRGDDRSNRNSLEISPAVRRDRLPSPAPAPVSTIEPPAPRATTVYVPLSDPVSKVASSGGVQLSDGPPRIQLSDTVVTPDAQEGRKGNALPPPPRPRVSTEPQIRLEDLKLPPRPDELDDEPFMPPTRPNPDSRPPSRGSQTGLSVLEEPIRRISGLWMGGSNSDDENDKEEPFDPELVSSPTALAPASPVDTRTSLYDRLASATSAAATQATTVVNQATQVLSNSTSSTKLYIPPVPTTPTRRVIDEEERSPISDRTASPTRVPPPMKAPPAPVPAVPHSSFGRVPKKSEKPEKKKTTWDSSDDEDDKSSKPAATNNRTVQIAQPTPKPAFGQRAVSMVETQMEDLESEEEDVPLKAIKGRTSRQSLRPSHMARSSKSSLKAGAQQPQVSPRPPPRMPSKSSLRPATVHTTSIITTTVTPPANTELKTSASKWSLSSDSQTVSPSSDDAIRPPSRPSSRNTTRSARPSNVHSPSQNPDRLRRPTASTSAQPSPRHEAVSLAAAHDSRNTASPASSRSGLTGDSSTQQPMTPKSNDPSRRSWADGRPRPSGESAASVRPATHFGDWAATGGPPGGFPMDMAMNPQQAALMKQQYQHQWMAAAQRYFDDAWERASTVSAAQTAPGPHGLGSGGPTYGYSYQNIPAPASAYGGYSGFSGYTPYGGFPGPQAGYPGMGGMPGMPGMPMGGMPGMPMGGMPMMPMGMPGAMPPGMPGGSMYSYGAMPAQSVYGGEFGPPVVPFHQQSEQPSSPRQSPRSRARRLSNTSDIQGGRPSTGMYQSGPGAASVTGVTPSRRPMNPGRRTSTLAMSEVAGPTSGPPSSWRRSAAEDEPTPRKRVTNAS